MAHNLPRKPVPRPIYSYMSIGDGPSPSSQTIVPTPVSPLNSLFSPLRSHGDAHALRPDQPLSVPSLQSISDEEPEEKAAASTSQWKVEWQTPALLLGLYFAALGAAIGHLIFFLKLDGTLVAEYYISQGYVTTISILIAAAWYLCLSYCLAIVFTQSLWNILATRFTSVGNIEKLYGLLGNVFLARPRLIISMPVLYLVAILTWSLPIVNTLPPGALTVESRPYLNPTDIVTPTFNSSFVGNGSIMDVAPYVPGGVTLFYVAGDVRLVIGGDPIQNNFKKKVTYFFATGELRNNLSPCGVNCTFAFEFEGPYLDCSTELRNTTIAALNNLVPNQTNQIEYPFYQADHNYTMLSMQRFKPLSVPLSTVGNSFIVKGDQTLAEINQTTCRYATAMYNVNVTYVNSLQKLTYTTRPLEPLDWTSHCQEDYKVPKLLTITDMSCGNFGDEIGSDGNIVLNTSAQQGIKALKNFTLIQYLLSILKGSMPLTCTLSDAVRLTDSSAALSCQLGLINDTAAPVIDTFIYSIPEDSYGSNSNIPQAAASVPVLHTSPDELNAVLFNLTMTYVYSIYNFMNTTAEATEQSQVLTFVFSQRLNLILPYFIPLALAIPALAYAFFLLYHKTHVAAMGNSFTQILMTTTGSQILTQTAAGGCLGGSNNIPKELEKLKIKYGDVTDSMAGVTVTPIRRAAFGVEGEVQPLRRRAIYGTVPASQP